MEIIDNIMIRSNQKPFFDRAVKELSKIHNKIKVIKTKDIYEKEKIIYTDITISVPDINVTFKLGSLTSFNETNNFKIEY